MNDDQFRSDVLAKLDKLSDQLDGLEHAVADRDEYLRFKINEWLAEQRELWLDRLMKMLGDGPDDDWWRHGREPPN